MGWAMMMGVAQVMGTNPTLSLVFAKDALAAIAKEALKLETGARGLRSVIESSLINVMFELPSRRDVTKCVVTREVIEKRIDPTLVTSERGIWAVKWSLVGLIALAACIPYARRRQVDWPNVLWFGGPGMAGAWAGASLATIVPGALQMALFAGVMLLAAWALP